MNAAGEALADLPPAYFALVMATGIVSIAADLSGMPLAAIGLFWFNVVAYAVLWLLTLLRAAWYGRRMLADVADHNRGVGFFNIVAATCVMGNLLVVVYEAPAAAAALWFFGIALWLLLGYSVFTAFIAKREKPTLDRGINGGWLVAVVAAQSVSVLGGLLATFFEGSRETVLFFTLIVWLVGGMLYIWIISLIFYRYMFFTLDPAHLAPPYWINMGAMAISTLAGAVLVGNAPYSPLLAELLPFLKGMTLLFWSTATWWIPMLLTLGFWRHVYRRFPLRYDPMYWGAVFPLGMYTVCTYRLAEAIEMPQLAIIPRYFLYIALAAWSLALLGLALRLVELARLALAGADGDTDGTAA